ncbi:hypothetical protein [Paraflavitalea pollutisoli]|uniref:hypothetical protein n=1 Tax=Paraflavitalea pollutisoli TaxID=3034143 RepID=UPI0023EC0733|nr:hypothetical protein [Paraflavitalea sp. H1-2-19X]
MLKRVLITIVAYVVIVVVLKTLLDDVNNSIYWILGGLLAIGIANSLDHKHIQELQIHEDTKTLSYQYRSPLNGEGEKVHILSQVQLYTQTKDHAGKGSEITSLTLYKNRRRVLKLQASADGFTPETLNAIRDQLLRLGVTE